MSGRILPDELWNRIQPLLPLPKPRRFRFPGRKPLDNRKAFVGILFVLKTGIRWEDLPKNWGVSGTTCWRRLRDWQDRGNRLVQSVRTPVAANQYLRRAVLYGGVG